MCNWDGGFQTQGKKSTNQLQCQCFLSIEAVFARGLDVGRCCQRSKRHCGRYCPQLLSWDEQGMLFLAVRGVSHWVWTLPIHDRHCPQHYCLPFGASMTAWPRKLKEQIQLKAANTGSSSSRVASAAGIRAASRIPFATR
jgi:hypothetical protein